MGDRRITLGPGDRNLLVRHLRKEIAEQTDGLKVWAAFDLLDRVLTPTRGRPRKQTVANVSAAHYYREKLLKGGAAAGER